jgi:2-(1,2-epoxy-1,2-dihydrophenyl)acetyl-CoA isomerase
MSAVICETLQGGVARVAINLPRKRNAIGPEVRDELIAIIPKLLDDQNVYAIIFGSEGGHFCSGGDVASMSDIDVQVGRSRMQANHKLVKILAEAEKPIISAVEGFALGAGAGICLLSDTVIVARSSKIGFPYCRIGLTPDYGILYTLPRRVGWGKARQILLRGRTLGGEEAVREGVADELTADGASEVRAIEIAEKMARVAPNAFALAKRHLMIGVHSLEAALELETLSQSLAFVGDELGEGRRAFLAKRQADFRKGKK